MKRIVLIILILVNLYVLSLIIFKKIDSFQENFTSNCSSQSNKLTVNVGNSLSNTKTVNNIQNLSCYDCPSFVNKTNFFNPGWARNRGNIFNVTTFPNDNRISVRRTDKPALGWGMNLKFQCNKKPVNETTVTSSSNSEIRNSEQNFDIPGGSITLYNVNNIVDKFYEVDSIEENCQNKKTCRSDSDCSASQECADILGDGVSKCYSFVPHPSFELESQNSSFIKLLNNNTKSFSFVFGFVLKNSESLKYIVSSKSNLWNIYNQQNNIFLSINDNFGITLDKVKLSINEIMCYKLYEIKISLTQKKINVNFNNQLTSTDAFFKLSECSNDTNCISGECLLNKCVLTSDEYYFGKLNNQYFDMFIGGVKMNSISSLNGQDDSCSFSGKEFNNKKLCIETCIDNGCENAYCEYECEKVPVCEFETIGRHSVDCIQECIKNNDCTSEFCLEKCENCAPNCPWNKKSTSSDDFDSQFFDPQGKPSPLKLTLNTISTDGTKVSIRWRSPYPGKSPIKGYMSYLYKTFNKSEGVKINKISLKNCEPTCEYIIKDLIPNETYTLGLKSYNDIGLSRTSNLLTFKASITNINMDLRIEDEVSENDIGDFNYCNA